MKDDWDRFENPNPSSGPPQWNLVFHVGIEIAVVDWKDLKYEIERKRWRNLSDLYHADDLWKD